MAAGRIRALTASHPIKPTSTRCPSAWRHNPGGRSTYRRGKSVQTTGTSSVRARGHFPTDEAALKLLFLVLSLAQKEWKMAAREWVMAKAQFAILFDGRFRLA